MGGESTQSPAAGEGQYRGGIVEELVLGAHDGGAIDAAVDGFCRSRLRAAVEEVLFRATSVGAVFGVRLEDGRRVVVKVHQPRESADSLRRCIWCSRTLSRAGFHGDRASLAAG
jgi:hypothetical protein